MAIATPEVYAEMLQTAKEKGFAYPAVNVTSSQTLNAAIRGFAEAGSDGIIQASTGGAAYWSGASKKDMVVGSLAFAAYAREVAKQYDVNIALHTDHCPKDKLEGFVLPLLAESEKAVARGEDPIFNSHMWDGSAIDLDENLKIAAELIERTSRQSSFSRLRLVLLAARKTALKALSTTPCTPPLQTQSRPLRQSAWARRAPTWLL